MSTLKKEPVRDDSERAPESRTTTEPIEAASTAVVKDSQGNQGQRLTQLQIAKAMVPDIFTLARILGWPIEAPGLNFAWYRNNTNTPSLSITECGCLWNDFALSEGGDAIKLLAKVENLSNSEACKRFIGISAEVQKKMTGAEIWEAQKRAQDPNRSHRVLRQKAAAEAEATAKRAMWTTLVPFEPISDADIGALAAARRWPESAINGLRLARERGLLFRTNYGGARCYVVTDSARTSAKVRRIDATEVAPGIKSKCLPGSRASWPLGSAEINYRDNVVLVEGEADQLALLSMFVDSSPAGTAVPVVISLAASSSLPPETIVILQRARSVTVVGDRDEAGRRAVLRWLGQLQSAGVTSRSLELSASLGELKDLSDLYTLSTTRTDCAKEIKAIVSKLLSAETTNDDTNQHAAA